MLAGSKVKGDPPSPSTLTPGRLDPSLIRPLPTPRTLGVFDGRPVPPATITPPPSSPSPSLPPSPSMTGRGLTRCGGILVADRLIAGDGVWVSVDRQPPQARRCEYEASAESKLIIFLIESFDEKVAAASADKIAT